ncbi:hypothetical protein AAEX28_13390 [Lentisphaerota bacterium WC36G]|nr:hypothetical protein LJT99_00145 [Lentisphaerae bacterium WC36]
MKKIYDIELFYNKWSVSIEVDESKEIIKRLELYNDTYGAGEANDLEELLQFIALKVFKECQTTNTYIDLEELNKNFINSELAIFFADKVLNIYDLDNIEFDISDFVVKES